MRLSTIFGISLIVVLITFFPIYGWIERTQVKQQLKEAIEIVMEEECGIYIEVTGFKISRFWGGTHYQAYSNPEIKYLSGEFDDSSISFSKPRNMQCAQTEDFRLNEKSGRFEPLDYNKFYRRQGTNTDVFIFVFILIFGPAIWFFLRIFRRVN